MDNKTKEALLDLRNLARSSVESVQGITDAEKAHREKYTRAVEALDEILSGKGQSQKESKKTSPKKKPEPKPEPKPEQVDEEFGQEVEGSDFE